MIQLWKGTSAPVAPFSKGQGAMPPSFHRSPASLKLPMMLYVRALVPPLPPFQRSGRQCPVMQTRSDISDYSRDFRKEICWCDLRISRVNSYRYKTLKYAGCFQELKIVFASVFCTFSNKISSDSVQLYIWYRNYLGPLGIKSCTEAQDLVAE